jgi:hypothetical protein
MKHLLTFSFLLSMTFSFAQKGESEFVKVNLPSKKKTTTTNTITPTSNTVVSDVDQDIPVVTEQNENRFALIIGNEDYSSFQPDLESEADVEFAMNDAKSFAQYSRKILGVPESNIILLLNGKLIEMQRSLDQISNIAKNLDGQAEIIFYYAGHGLPEESTKEPYIMPVDVSGADIKYALKLEDVYTRLTENPSKKVTVFLDACFSGGGRNQGLVSARGVKVNPKQKTVQKGNLVVFSAASGSQTSLPYKEQGHGLYTYYLLKILKMTEGDISYEELDNYVTKQTTINSVMVNSKEQNPQVNSSPDIAGEWKKWTFK